MEAIFGQFSGKLCHYWGNCDTFEAILDFLGQIVALLGQFVAILEGFNILIYVGIYASVYKGFNDFAKNNSHIYSVSCFMFGTFI